MRLAVADQRRLRSPHHAPNEANVVAAGSNPQMVEVKQRDNNDAGFGASRTVSSHRIRSRGRSDRLADFDL
jgi:hypothetical protein